MKAEFEKMIDAYGRDNEGSLPPAIIDDIKESLPEKVTKQELVQILKEIGEAYKFATVHAGESVGLVSAESIG